MQILTSIDSVGEQICHSAIHHLDTVFRHIAQSYDGAVTNDKFLRLITGEPHPLANFAVLRDAGDLSAVKEAIEPLMSCGFPVALLLLENSSDDSTQQLLSESGFQLAETMPAMAIDLQNVAHTELVDGYAYTRIGEEQGEAWAAALAVGYDLPLGAARLFSPACLGADMSADAPIQFFAAKKDEEIVATAMICMIDGVAGIYCISTLPDERGKGLGAHVTAEPLRAACSLGYSVAVLQSSTAGHSVYLRLGFQNFGEIPVYVRMPA